MPLWAEFMIAGVAALGIMVVSKHIMIGLEMSRRPAHPDTPLKDAPSSDPRFRCRIEASRRSLSGW